MMLGTHLYWIYIILKNNFYNYYKFYRYENHILEVKHQYKSPINTVEFHEPSKNILSSSKKALKINSSIDAKHFTTIEP